MKSDLWLVFVVGAVLSWGAYVPVLHEGQNLLNRGSIRAFLCVGIAYFLTAVLLCRSSDCQHVCQHGLASAQVVSRDLVLRGAGAGSLGRCFGPAVQTFLGFWIYRLGCEDAQIRKELPSPCIACICR